MDDDDERLARLTRWNKASRCKEYLIDGAWRSVVWIAYYSELSKAAVYHRISRGELGDELMRPADPVAGRRGHAGHIRKITRELAREDEPIKESDFDEPEDTFTITQERDKRHNGKKP